MRRESIGERHQFRRSNYPKSPRHIRNGHLLRAGVVVAGHSAKLGGMSGVSRTWVLAGVAVVTIGAITAALTLTGRNGDCRYTEADVDVAIFGKKAARSDELSQLRALTDRIEGIDGVEAVFYRSPEEALAQFEASLGDNEDIAKGFPPGGYKPDDFAASLRVVVHSSTDPEDVIERVPNSSVIDEVHVSGTPSEAAALFGAEDPGRSCLSR